MNTNEAARLARSLMNEHGLTDWYFQFDRAKRRFGRCSFGPRCISLSEPLVRLNDERQVRDTVLHEIAHALAGASAKHGPRWKAMCRQIGADPTRCFDAEAVATPPAPYVWSCEHCGPIEGRHKRATARTPSYKHKGCGGKLTIQPNHTRWTPADKTEAVAASKPAPTIQLDQDAQDRIAARAAERAARIRRNLA